MSDTIVFTVRGTPVPQPRGRGEIRKQYAEIGEEPAVHVWITPRPRPW